MAQMDARRCETKPMTDKQKHAGGRPVKYETPEEMQRLIALYFLACRVHQSGDDTLLEGLEDDELLIVNDISDIHPTVTGLALSLDMTRKGLIDYENKENPEFGNAIKRAKGKVEAYIEQRLYEAHAGGCIFNLKNNYGWKDKQEIEHSGSFNVNMPEKDANSL